MKTLDILVFDMQDIGSRSYTYISTLGEAMAACAKAQKTLVVLDRPNPIGGNRVEGSSAQFSYLSFVSPYPIAYCYGLTIGELATLINGRKYLPGKVPCSLKIVKMRGYNRTMTWQETGLPWIATSPEHSALGKPVVLCGDRNCGRTVDAFDWHRHAISISSRRRAQRGCAAFGTRIDAAQTARIGISRRAVDAQKRHVCASQLSGRANYCHRCTARAVDAG